MELIEKKFYESLPKVDAEILRPFSEYLLAKGDLRGEIIKFDLSIREDWIDECDCPFDFEYHDHEDPELVEYLKKLRQQNKNELVLRQLIEEIKPKIFQLSTAFKNDIEVMWQYGFVTGFWIKSTDGLEILREKLVGANFDSLHFLWFDHTELQHLPDWLQHLTQLKHLLINEDDLTVIPGWIGDLNLLAHLNINCTRLNVLPRTIGKLSMLTELSISNCSLTEIPMWIGNFARLERLDLENNKLTHIPVWIDKLSKLTRLNLNDNDITELPASIGNLHNLKELNLRNNKLTSLPESLANIQDLDAVLDLDGNCIKKLPESFDGLIDIDD